ncbi:hypothetical protein VFPFJ_05906 [Purpureocillium lilacinum]|uniref:Uncharacterized protein n=1 Tax=Purpureocillium lilacinum TaxID=33203 RepID=A0A179HHI2_PURLI|nr:hypothetical protein VFPFJ_05906 [Purpureocillium lilacinum]OAQ89494.1 hypothetical protein VFPFJ_05906 [Purpureocillium lilacinum]
MPVKCATSRACASLCHAAPVAQRQHPARPCETISQCRPVCVTTCRTPAITRRYSGPGCVACLDARHDLAMSCDCRTAHYPSRAGRQIGGKARAA